MDGSTDIDPLDPAKFRDPDVTLSREPRAHVRLDALRTLWFNTGSLCNLACRNCYIESSPRNDRLAYLSYQELRDYLARWEARTPDDGKRPAFEKRSTG